MDEKPDQIMNHIDTQRQELGRNLNELETRVKGATDWRMQFDKNPMLMMGVALGGGLLLGTMVGGKRSSSSRPSSYPSRNYTSSTMRSGGTGATAYGLSSSGSSDMSSSSSSSGSSASSSPAVREQRRKATDTLEHMKAALIGFGVAKVKEFMTEALPGFDRHLDEAERKNSQHQGGGSMHSYGGGSGSHGQEQSGSYSTGSSQQGNQASTRGESGSYGSQQHDNQPVGVNPGLNI